MTRLIAREPNGFIPSPFDDRFFREIAALCAYEREGHDQEWPADVIGYQSRDDENHPPSMQEFSFQRGNETYDGGLSLSLASTPTVTYCHTALSRPHLIMRNEIYPETVWQALNGKPLTRLLDLPFAADWIVAGSEPRPTSLIVYRDILIQPLG